MSPDLQLCVCLLPAQINGALQSVESCVYWPERWLSRYSVVQVFLFEIIILRCESSGGLLCEPTLRVMVGPPKSGGKKPIFLDKLSLSNQTFDVIQSLQGKNIGDAISIISKKNAMGEEIVHPGPNKSNVEWLIRVN